MLRLPALSLALGLLLSAPLVARAAVTARIDPGHSSAEFSVRHLVISNVRGTVPIREGSVVTDGTSTMPTALSATLDATHLTTQNDDRDADLHGPDWFDVTKYPTIVFKSTKIVPGPDGTFSATGDLTIRDITRSVTLAGKTLGSTVDQRGRRHVGYEATTSLDRRQFGLTLLKESPGVGLIAGTDVAVTIDVEAVSGP
jgi:polyisoprenoid-binding protein YceI